MTNLSEEDAQFFAHLQHIILYHQTLARDGARNQLFYRALERVVDAGTRVLDIGSGSGLWAIAAAKLGAKSVTAIEGDSAMIPVIEAHARENGVTDRIHIIRGNSLEVEPGGKFDVIVSETIGNRAFEEGIITTMLDARSRFLAPGGVIIPQSIALVAAPVHLETGGETPSGVPIRTEYLRSLALNLNFKVDERKKLRLLGEPIKLLEVDLREITAEPGFTGMRAEWGVEDLSQVNAVALWAHSTLIDGIDLDTWETINWSPVVCGFEPFNGREGELAFELNLNAKQYHWTVKAPSASNGQSRSYTPMFAYARLKFDSQRAGGMAGEHAE